MCLAVANKFAESQQLFDAANGAGGGVRERPISGMGGGEARACARWGGGGVFRLVLCGAGKHTMLLCRRQTHYMQVAVLLCKEGLLHVRLHESAVRW